MRRHFALLLLATTSLFAAPAAAAPRQAADMLPATTLLYVEIARPKDLLDVILEHPLKERIESLDGYQQALKKRDFQQLRGIVQIVETQLGMGWQEAMAVLAEGGIYAGWDSETRGVALLTKSRGQQDLAQARDVLLRLLRDHASRHGTEAVRTESYREIRSDAKGDVTVSLLGSWLLVTNNQQLYKRLVDQYLDGRSSSLSEKNSFRQARGHMGHHPAVWLFANATALREAGIARELFKGQADNPLAELLVGGLLGVIQKSPFVAASLSAERSQSTFALSMPYDFSWIPAARHYYFGPHGKGTAPPLIQPDRNLLSLSTYREISGMWLHAGDLFDEGVNDELAKADSNLSTLFAGKDFGSDILGALQPEICLVVARQDFGNQLPCPAIKLPTFGLVFRLKEPERMQGELRRIFQSLIGFINVVGAMNGQPQLDLDMEKADDRQIVTATYVPEAAERDSDQARLHFNFSPSVAFVAERFVIASTKGLTHELVERLTADGSAGPEEGANTVARANLTILRQILEDNRAQLVAQNMLKEGNSKEEAEAAIEALLAILGTFRDASLRVSTGTEALELQLKLR